MTNQQNLPAHIAIIMDGNGTWAALRGLPRAAGHAQGVKTVRVITEACAELGVKALTLFTFSTENFKRPKEEIEALMNMLSEQIEAELPRMMKNNIRFNVIGDPAALPREVQKKIVYTEEKTSSNSGLILTLALNYGGRLEIVTAAKRIAQDAVSGKIDPHAITEDKFQQYLYTNGLPALDLLIRTSGQMRISNFLLWQVSYAEIYVTEKLWPDFKKDDLLAAIEEFKNRQRRFGGL